MQTYVLIALLFLRRFARLTTSRFSFFVGYYNQIKTLERKIVVNLLLLLFSLRLRKTSLGEFEVVYLYICKFSN